jgi:hypothetical protein
MSGLPWNTSSFRERPVSMTGGLPGTSASARRPAPSVPDGYVRAFRRSTRTAHLVDELDDLGLGTPALCGTEPILGEGWKGHGSWGETQTLNAMPLCRRCEKRINA